MACALPPNPICNQAQARDDDMREMIRFLVPLSIAIIFTPNALAQNVPQPRSAQRPAQYRQIRPPQPAVQTKDAPPVFSSGAVAPVSPQISATAVPRSNLMVTTVSLGDLGFKNGIRFANLGGRHEIFVPLPQSANLSATELALVVDDMSAHEARRNVEILVNDRSVAAIPLDGKGVSRTIRVPLGRIKAREGFLKVAFVYSGAATQDRCIDVRYVGDSLTLRPESGIDLEFDPETLRDVATIAALMPRDVNILLPDHQLSAVGFATALTVSRSIMFTGRRASFSTGNSIPSESIDAQGRRQWTRGSVVIGSSDELTGTVQAETGSQVPMIPGVGAINAIQISGYPALIVSEGASVRAAALLGNPSIAAARGLTNASVASVGTTALSSDHITFDQLGLEQAATEVYGRADIAVAIDTRNLPANTQLARLLLDIMVAPDSAGEKAVVSVFVNEKLLESAVAAQGEPTRIDIPLPNGLVDTIANIRAVVQRRSAQGDCRFEPQGYPAQILGSSAIILAPAGAVHDFADLSTQWGNGVAVMAPPAAAKQPEKFLSLLASMVGNLTPELAPISVMFVDNATAAKPTGPFIVVSELPPNGSDPHVHFDRGRVEVKDRSGHTLLDLGGFASGAVAQLVRSEEFPGIWIKPLAADGTLPSPPLLRLGRGDVAFIDEKGTALSMSTDRDTVVRVFYVDQVSWTTVAKRFQSWIVGAIWLFVTFIFLFILQRIRRRRPRSADE